MSKKYYSYHIFYFPFKWEIENVKEQILSEQIDMNRIKFKKSGRWQRVTDVQGADAEHLYNEQNFFYQFVHKVLYDDHSKESFIYHFERCWDADSEVRYEIKVKSKESPYSLKVEAINLNLYATGVGFLSFYLANDREDQSSKEDILRINQYGRRIMPPFFSDIISRYETAEWISITGLEEPLKETFDYQLTDSWKPASFITQLINGLTHNLSFVPIIDDRMFVLSWYTNDSLCEQFKSRLGEALKDKAFNDYWYQFLYVDGGYCTCQNDEMRYDLLKQHTYPRWEGESSLYGSTRYSMVFLTSNSAPAHLFVTFETIYSRMAELVLMQRASMLRFSEEVTKVSHLSNKETEAISLRISSLYKEYIHFVNQIYFREITAQDQGIELYEMLQKNLKMEDYVKDLDEEIGELHQYVSLMDDRDRNKKATLLNNLATFFLPMSVITGFFGMNTIGALLVEEGSLFWQAVSIFMGCILALCFIINRKRRL